MRESANYIAIRVSNLGKCYQIYDTPRDRLKQFIVPHLQRLVGQTVKTSSSGMLVRLAFSVAVQVDPDILIVDEALSVGDIRFQVKCHRKFEEFRDMGKTIIFVSQSRTTIYVRIVQT